MIKPNRLHRRGHQRRGTIYVIVLLSSLLVVTIGLSSLQLIRLQSRTAAESSDFIGARAYARAAIDIGMLKIRNDATWRVSLGNGAWVTDKPIDAGTYSISAIDPIDNDITSGDNHPIILTGVGKKGAASFQVSTRLEVGPRVSSCLDVAMISDQSTTLNAATLTSDQWVSTNSTFIANSSNVNANVEALGSISGSAYNQSVLQIPAARAMPDSFSALDYYLNNGTTIPVSALTLWNATNLVTNGDFEVDTSGWSAPLFTTLSRVSSPIRTGISSLRVSRLVSSGAAVYALPVASIKRGHTYRLSMPLYTGAGGTVQGVLSLTSTGEGTQTFTTPAFNTVKNGWTMIAADFTPTWTGDLTGATLSTTTSFSNVYYLDTVTLTDVTYASGTYVLDGKLLSPTSNPFGTPNPQGIYIISCGDNRVIVGRSRIVGTLVFINAGINSTIAQSVSLEPAIENFPSLLTDKPITIRLGSGGLNETEVGVNFNPTGTPYPFLGGVSNELLTDFYPSRINGLMYSVKDFLFADSNSLTGVVIASKAIQLDGGSVTINYNNIYLNDPPPGFDVGKTEMKIIPGTWQRTVN